jgi:hypothetical protein
MPSWHLPGGTKKNHKEPESRWPIPELKFELKMSVIMLHIVSGTPGNAYLQYII